MCSTFVQRYRGKVTRIYFRADAAFAMPEVTSFSKRSGSSMALVDDKISDIEAGAAVGIGLRILLARGTGKVGTGAPPHETVVDLQEALTLLRSRFVPTAASPHHTNPGALGDLNL
jgi:hypothetical protein